MGLILNSARYYFVSVPLCLGRFLILRLLHKFCNIYPILLFIFLISLVFLFLFIVLGVGFFLFLSCLSSACIFDVVIVIITWLGLSQIICLAIYLIHIIIRSHLTS